MNESMCSDLGSSSSRVWVGNLKQRVPIPSKSTNFKVATQHYVVKLPKSAGARHYCPNILRVPGTLCTRANSSPEYLQKYHLEGPEGFRHRQWFAIANVLQNSWPHSRAGCRCRSKGIDLNLKFSLHFDLTSFSNLPDIRCCAGRTLTWLSD